MKKISGLKLTLAAISMAAFAGGLVACNEGDGQSSTERDLWLDRTAYTFQVGDTMELNVYDGLKEVVDVMWTSDNPQLVTVDSSGKITALGTGKTNVIATVEDQKFTCKITVSARTVDFLSAYDNVNLDIDDETNEYPRSVDLDIIIDLNKVNTELPISYTSSNPSVATVENGVITAVKKGSATVTASTVVGNVTYSKEYSVAVYPKSIIHENEVEFIKTENAYGDGLEFSYTEQGEIDFVVFDNQKLEADDYVIANEKILLKKSVYRKDGVMNTGRHNLYVSVIKNEDESDRYCYPFVLADYVLNTVADVKALGAVADVGGIEGAYIVLGQDIEYTDVEGYSGRTVSHNPFTKCTIDGYGHGLKNWNVIAGWSIFGSISNSKVIDLSIVNTTYGSNTWSLLFTTVTGVTFENLFISVTKTAYNGVYHAIIGLDLKGVTMRNCVILSAGAASNFELGRVDNVGAARSLTIENNVFVSDYLMLLDREKGMECFDSVNGENALLKNGDSAGLIAALKVLAANENNFTFDETTNTLSLFGNVVHVCELN